MLDFELFWKTGPWVKLGKKGAVRHFNATVKTEEDSVAIQTARDVYADHLKANRWKRPQIGSTWFNNWRDWYELERAEAIADDPDYFRIEGSHRGNGLTDKELEGARELIELRKSRGEG